MFRSLAMILFCAGMQPALAQERLAIEVDYPAISATPVSIVGSAHGMLVADYLQVYLFKDGALRKFNIEKRENEHWHPTALAIDERSSEIFIANYTGNNILVGHVDYKAHTIKIERELGDIRTISPEGIAIGESVVAVANYDGSNIQIFQRNGRKGDSAICDIPLALAHGITYSSNYFYASSLKDRKVVKIEPVECKIIDEIGEFGWGSDGFLWPTAISAMDDGKIVVSDAHTGRLTVISTDTFKIIDRFGANGPGQFNMPYGVTWHEGEIWVASSFNQTLIRLHELSWDSAVFYHYETRSWIWPHESFPKDAYLSALNYDGYTHKGQVIIQGKCYVLGYGEVSTCSPNEDVGIVVPKSIRGSYLYFIQSSRLANGVLLSSPQTLDGLFYADSGGSPVEIEIGLDAWVVDGVLVGPSGPVSPRVPNSHD